MVTFVQRIERVRDEDDMKLHTDKMAERQTDRQTNINFSDTMRAHVKPHHLQKVYMQVNLYVWLVVQGDGEYDKHFVLPELWKFF